MIFVDGGKRAKEKIFEIEGDSKGNLSMLREYQSRGPPNERAKRVSKMNVREGCMTVECE